MTFNGVLQVSVHHDDLTRYLRRRHSVSKLVVHLIFTTKYRRKLLDGTMIVTVHREDVDNNSSGSG